MQFDLKELWFADISVLIVVTVHVLLATVPQDGNKLGNSFTPGVLERQETRLKDLGQGMTAHPKDHGGRSGMQWDSSRYLIAKLP
ncbi:MAG: hypothetical protein IIA65_00210 [Planctomycetes bacterium]|nr:hypothetical protein [Planctomycetota bacterium]